MYCTHTNAIGLSCQAPAMTGEQYCFSHHPNTREAHKEAAKRGGKVEYYEGLIKLKSIDFTQTEAILYLLADTINRVRKTRLDGSMDVKVANCIGFLASKMLDAQQSVNLEERVTRLEEEKDSRKGFQ